MYKYEDDYKSFIHQVLMICKIRVQYRLVNDAWNTFKGALPKGVFGVIYFHFTFAFMKISVHWDYFRPCCRKLTFSFNTNSRKMCLWTSDFFFSSLFFSISFIRDSRDYARQNQFPCPGWQCSVVYAGNGSLASLTIIELHKNRVPFIPCYKLYWYRASSKL